VKISKVYRVKLIKQQILSLKKLHHLKRLVGTTVATSNN